MKAVIDLPDRGRIAERVAFHVRIEIDVPDGGVAVGRSQSIEVKPREGVTEAGLAAVVEGFDQQDRLATTYEKMPPSVTPTFGAEYSNSGRGARRS